MRMPLAAAFLFLPHFLLGAVGFNKDIRPIMSDTCFRCHGPDRNARMAGLRLDIRDEALKTTASGVRPIVPGKAEESAIVARVFSENPAKVMPPQYAHKVLSKKQKELIREWVVEGAKYEGHWAYERVKRPLMPEASSGAASPIDAFIRSRLLSEGLKPSPEADRATLIRRVTLDLTGLPPRPADVAAFAKDSSPSAYEKVVDRLLASPHYAEKQAMHWLDAVRYADTTGFHGDNSLPAWPYRDYVLRAFRDNKPFDVFTREQLAGDLMPDATTEQKIASAYNRMGRTSAEGGLQPKEYLAKYAADRVRTLSSVWLGSTMGCSECHDHKFDPFTARDFYSMEAFFADLKETGLVPVTGPNAYGSHIALPNAEQRDKLESLNGQIETSRQKLEEKAGALAQRRSEWEKQVLVQHKAGALAWRFQRPLSARSRNGAMLAIYNDEPVDSNFYFSIPGGASTLVTEHKPGEGLVVVSGPNPETETYTVTFQPGEGEWTAMGLEAQQDESLPAVRLARGADRFVLTEVDAELSAEGREPARKLPLVLATHDGFGQPAEHPAMAAIDGDPNTGWGISFGESRSPFLALRFAFAVHTGAKDTITVRLDQDSRYRRATIGRFRLALSSACYSWPDTGDSVSKGRARKGDVGTLTIAADRGLPPALVTALEKTDDGRTKAQRKMVADAFVFAEPDLQPLVVEIAQLEARRSLLQAAIPDVVVSEAVAPRQMRVLPRGNFLDESGAVVEPAIPAFLGKLDGSDRTSGERATRLDLANWIVSPQNPLTARVFANRMWRQFFGAGLSKVLEDLGSQGEWPTHPELLDWLAAEFMEPAWNAEGAHAWDVRHLIRAIVTSQTYRQSSASTPLLDERDPDNRLLARQSRFRVDAEAVRDIALSVSGLLKEDFGGPSVNPYEPEGYLAAMNFPKRDYSASHGPDLYRRGLYTQWQRTFLHPSLLTFDAPTREECTVNRVTSNTPLQALELLNDPIFVEAARVFAQKILESGGSFDKRLDWAFARALSREPSAEERAILTKLHGKNLARFRAAPGSAKEFLAVGEAPLPQAHKPADLAAMTAVARVILNLHEVITRN